jgi:hypothetical protein
MEDSCKDCGSKTSSWFLNGEKEKVYWFGTLKGTKDFMIMKSNADGFVEIKFLTYGFPNFPSNHTKLYDWFCNKCYLNLMYEQGYKYDEQ